MRLSAALPVILTLALTACGFHLRGQQPVPDGWQQVAVRDVVAGDDGIPRDKGTWYTTGREGLRREVVRELRDAGFTVLDAAPLRVELLASNIRRRTASIDANANAGEYQIEYEVRYRVVGADGAELVPATLLRTDSSYRFNEAAMLGSAEQEALLYEDMRRDLARRVVDQLRRKAAVRAAAP